MTRLEWTHHADSNRMRATAGHLNLRASVNTHNWWVTIDVFGGGLCLARGSADSLADAQAAAEEAALSLLVEGVAAFEDGDPVNDVVRVDGTNCPGAHAGHVNVCAYDFQGAWTVWMGVADPDAEGDTTSSVALDVDGALRLGRALIAAALRARKETDR